MNAPGSREDELAERLLGWFKLCQELGAEWPDVAGLVGALAPSVSSIGVEGAIEEAYLAGAAAGILLERRGRQERVATAARMGLGFLRYPDEDMDQSEAGGVQ